MIDFSANQLGWLERARWKNQFERNPLSCFLPNKAQARLAQAMGTLVPEKRIFVMTSGNGAGKSAISLNIVGNLVLKNINMYRGVTDVQTGEKQSGFFDYPFFNHYPDWPKVIWYVSNQESLRSIWDEFRLWFPANIYTDYKDGKTYVSRVKFPTGWTMYFRTIEQDPQTFESANVGVIIFDEPPPQAIYKACLSRTRSGAVVLIAATPVNKCGWMKSEVVDKAVPDSYIFHQQVSCWENCVERAGEWDLGQFGRQKKGNLREANLAFTLSQYEEHERKSRETGQFLFLSGLVYQGYEQNLHMREMVMAGPPKQYMYRMIIDPHDRRPPAVIWVRYDQWGRKHVIREWPGVDDPEYHGALFHTIRSAEPYTVKDFVRRWCEIEDLLQIPKDRLECVMDPNFGKKPNSVTGKMLFEEYQDEFLINKKPRSFVLDVNDDLYIGHKAVRDQLKRGPDGDIKFSIDPKCRNIDWAFRNYVYDDWEGKTADRKELKEAVQERAKDFMDCVRYDAMVPMSYRKLPKQYSKEDYDEDFNNTTKTTWRNAMSNKPSGVY
jgi:phage terminase large subunit-like protein